jgi:putative transposase
VEVNKKHNAVFSLFYHLIICTKYRRKIFINDKIITELKSYVEELSPKIGGEIIEIGCGEDHIHILFSSKPTLNITKFINILKTRTSVRLKRDFYEEIKEKLWKEHIWSPSYYIASTGNISLEKLTKYIENQ